MTKTISLSDEAYEALAGLKESGESFSDVALRLARTKKRPSILDAAGAWKMSEGEAEQMLKKIYDARIESARPRVRFE